MKMKKVSIASLAIGAMLSVTACSPSAEKDQAKKEQTNVQEEATTTNTEETSVAKSNDKETNTSSNEKTEKDQKNAKESSGKESNATSTNQNSNGKTTEKETNTKENNTKTSTKETNKGAPVKTNVKEVVQLVESLDKQLAANPKLDTVNKLGKQINEKWDVIEKELEANHPTDYKTIGQSMYPLIVATEKEKIDVKRIKSLTTKTKQDLNQLLNKL
ncbi:hypothetical protein COI93_10725 [Bacillus cereus]|uniref:Lipoprotein n=1 Tax=Bacillus cereus TaxID=1396 RepID=A0A2B0MGM4_BACCE|nr:hypothetical protein COI93_10725 [Bacillus cereus]